MKAGRSHRRQDLGGMMYLVKLPKQRDSVLHVMRHEVAEVVADKESDRTGHFERDRPEYRSLDRSEYGSQRFAQKQADRRARGDQR